MRVFLAQINPTVGDISGNVAKIAKTLQKANSERAELVVFPELCLAGYPPNGLLGQSWFMKAVQQGTAELKALSKQYPSLGFVCGVPTAAPQGGFYNSALLFHDGDVCFTQHKTVLRSDGKCDEECAFMPGPGLEVYAFRDEVLAITIGDDSFGELAEQGATLAINLSASHFYLGKPQVWAAEIQSQAEQYKIPVVVVNQVGGQDELVFDGGSMFCDKSGQLAAFSFFEEEFILVDTAGPAPKSAAAPDSDAAWIYAALKLGLADYMNKTGQKRAIIGLSGGIDSAVLCALAVDTLGQENVRGINMPGPYSSQGSISDSRALAENLGIRFDVVPITTMYQSYLDSLAGLFEGREENVAEENIQARIRGNILMAISNKFGGMVLVPSNKSESAVGYSTLYGDMTGGLAPLADVYKTMVYDLAAYINREKEIIPQASISKPPSAELRPGQKDADSLPPYDVLDPILTLYVDEGLAVSEIVERGFPQDTVEWVVKTVSRAEFKRRQAAPNLVVSMRPFGFGLRMPIAARYEV